MAKHARSARGVSDPQRHPPIERTRNLLDARGYPAVDGRVLRWRTLFLSDNLRWLTEGGRDGLAELGVCTVVDVRHAGEVERWPNALGEADRFAYHHLPVATQADFGRLPAKDLEELNRNFLH